MVMYDNEGTLVKLILQRHYKEKKPVGSYNQINYLQCKHLYRVLINVINIVIEEKFSEIKKHRGENNYRRGNN